MFLWNCSYKKKSVVEKTIVTKSSILDFAEVLGPLLA